MAASLTRAPGAPASVVQRAGQRRPRPDLPAQIAALELQLAALRAELDAELVLAIATVVGDRVFTSRELWHHAAVVSPALRQAFMRAGLRSARRLGKRLAVLQARALGALRLERVGASNQGAEWVVRVVADSHHDR